MPVCMKVSKVDVVEVPGLEGQIKAARKADKRSLLEICRQLKESGQSMTPANWYKIESGETKTLPLETLRKIEEVLGVDFGVEI